MSVFGKAFGRLVDACTPTILKKRSREVFTEEVAQTSEDRASQRPRISVQQPLLAPDFQWSPKKAHGVENNAASYQRTIGSFQQERTAVPSTPLPAFTFSPSVWPVHKAQRPWAFSRVARPAGLSQRNQRAYARGFYGEVGREQGPGAGLGAPWLGSTPRLPGTVEATAASIPRADPWQGPGTPYDRPAPRVSSRLTPRTLKSMSKLPPLAQRRAAAGLSQGSLQAAMDGAQAVPDKDAPATVTASSLVELLSRVGISEEASEKQGQLADASRQAIEKLLSAQRLTRPVLSRAETEEQAKSPLLDEVGKRAVALETEVLKHQKLFEAQAPEGHGDTQQGISLPRGAAESLSEAGQDQEGSAFYLVSSDEEEEEGDHDGQRVYDDSGYYSQEEDLEEDLRSMSVSEDQAAVGRRLTKTEEKMARSALAGPDSEEVLATHLRSGIDMTRRLIHSLKPGEWLNDEVINMYMGLLQDRDNRRRAEGLRPFCHFHTSFFATKLMMEKNGYEYSLVSRWTLPKKLKILGQASTSLLDVDRIIIPVHLTNHWVCAVIDMENQVISYMDSLGGRNSKVTNGLLKWVEDEYRDKRKEEVDMSSWRIEYRQCPRQQNGSDCGVFALQCAEYEGRGAPYKFSQDDMPYYRLRIVADLLQKKVADVPP